MPDAKNSIECLFSSPSPAKAPNSSQRRWSPPFRMRSATAAHAIQSTGSKAFIERKLSKVRYIGAVSVATAARICANFHPPISRAIHPASHTFAAAESAGKNRRAARESPSVARVACAIHATSGA